MKALQETNFCCSKNVLDHCGPRFPLLIAAAPAARLRGERTAGTIA
jgi:hypothetical protein